MAANPVLEALFTRHDSTSLFIGHIHLFESEGSSVNLFFFICLLSVCFPLAGSTLTTNICPVDDAV